MHPVVVFLVIFAIVVVLVGIYFLVKPKDTATAALPYFDIKDPNGNNCTIFCASGVTGCYTATIPNYPRCYMNTPGHVCRPAGSCPAGSPRCGTNGAMC